MANVANKLPAITSRRWPGKGVFPVLVSIDTLDEDLTVYTPAAGASAAIVGWQYAVAAAHGLTVKSGATSLVTYQMPANSGRNDAIQGDPIIEGGVGEALKIASSAAIPSMLLYVAEVE